MSDRTPHPENVTDENTGSKDERRLPSSVRQLGLLFRQYADVRFLLFNRFMVVLIGMLLVSGSAIAYTSVNDDARIYGTVTDANGDPVANATVVLEKLDIGTVPDPRKTKTDEDGRFVFTGQSDLLEFRLHATFNGSKSEMKHVHLYYKSQSRRIDLTITGTNGGNSA